MKKRWLWAGVDLGVETASVCIIDGTGVVLHEAVCASTAKSVRHELITFRRPRYASVALEAGTGGHVARGLRSLGYPVELYESRQLSKFLRARRNKTDAGDANGIAEAARIGVTLVSKVHLKSLDSQALLSRLAIRTHLIRQRVAATNMLGRQIEVFGGRLRGKLYGDRLRSAVNTEIRRLFAPGSTALLTQVRFLTDHCERLVSYQRSIDQELERVAKENQVCQRLMEIPGVGTFCALNFYAAVDDPYRFPRSADIGSYFGLAPAVHESGLTSRRAKISKMGNKSVRSLLVHAAGMHMRYCEPHSPLREWALAVEQRRGRLPSRVALARKLVDWRDDMGKQSPRQADAVFGVLRLILEWGRNRGLIGLNHATRPKKLYRADRSDKLWLPSQLDAFRAVASPQMRLALELGLWTGQRQSDLLKLGWASYDGARLTLRQGKRKRKVDMPVAAPLKALLDATERKALTILTAPNGKPWRTDPKPTYFQHLWRKASLAAGVDGLHFHDLRGTTCTLLAEAGATPSEIAAMLGWTVTTVNQMLDTYQAMTRSLSDSAVAKLERKAG